VFEVLVFDRNGEHRLHPNERLIQAAEARDATSA
jgi:hypothetical protein